MRTSMAVFLLGILSLTTPAFSQQATGPLTLHQITELVKKNNLSLQQQQKRVEQAMAEITVQKAGYWPTLNLGSSASHVSKVAQIDISFPPLFSKTINAGVKNQYDINLNITQPVFTGFRTQNLVRSAGQQLEQRKSEKEAAQNGIILQVQQIYYTLQANLLQRQVLHNSALRIDDHLRQTLNFYHNAQATAFDTLEAANRLLETQTRLMKLVHQRNILLSQLASVLNFQQIDSVAALDVAHIPIEIRAQNEYQSMAADNRPELFVSRHQEKELVFRKKALQSQYYPQLFAQAAYHYAKPGVNFFKSEWMDYYTVGVQLQWELWNFGKRKNQVRQTEYAQKSVGLEVQKVQQNIRQDVVKAYEGLRSAAEQITLHRRLVSQEEERYRMARQRYGQGLATSVELRDAENSLTSAQFQLQQDYVDFLMNQALMNYAVGDIGK